MKYIFENDHVRLVPYSTSFVPFDLREGPKVDRHTSITQFIPLCMHPCPFGHLSSVLHILISAASFPSKHYV